jgi:hypothetical protein
LEQSLVAVQTLIEDHGKRSNAQDQVWHSVRSLSEQIADRQGQVEKALSVVQATQEAEKGLIAHFEKVLGAVRARMADLETRQAQAELNVAALKPAGGDTPAINETALAAVQELMREVKERQSESEKEWAALSSLHQQLQDGQARTEQMLGATMTLVEEVQKAAARASEQVTRVEENSAQAIEAARSAQALAAQALEKANEIPGPSEIPPGAELSGEQQQELTEGFQQFLKRCETEHKSLLEQEGRIQTQLRIALESFPARTEAAVNKFLEQSRTRVEQSCLSWLQHRERRIVDLENHFDGIVGKALQTQKVLEEQIAKSAAAHSVEEPPEMSELMQVLESTSAAHSSELRFVKTLLWVTLAGVGLAYALVVYAVILRS